MNRDEFARFVNAQRTFQAGIGLLDERLASREIALGDAFALGRRHPPLAVAERRRGEDRGGCRIRDPDRPRTEGGGTRPLSRRASPFSTSPSTPRRPASWRTPRLTEASSPRIGIKRSWSKPTPKRSPTWKGRPMPDPPETREHTANVYDDPADLCAAIEAEHLAYPVERRQCRLSGDRPPADENGGRDVIVVDVGTVGPTGGKVPFLISELLRRRTELACSTGSRGSGC